MKHDKWIVYTGFAMLLIATLASSQQGDTPVRSRTGSLDWSNPATGHGGRPMTPAESTLVERAIDSIKTSPPDSIGFTDADGNEKKWSCDDIGDFLRQQLREGRMEAETLKSGTREHACAKCDGKESSKGDHVNISDSLLKEWAKHDSCLRYLEETIIHEYVHKRQKGEVLKNKAKREYEAYDAEIAYKDSIGMAHTDPYYQFCLKNWLIMSKRLAGQQYSRSHYTAPARAHQMYIAYDTSGGLADDSLISFESAGPGRFSMSFAPTHASDLLIFEAPQPLLPPDHCLGVVCGGLPGAGIAQIIALDILDGQVLGAVPRDFGPPSGDPTMFFYSMDRTDAPGFEVYYVLDTLNHQIVTMFDLDGDLIPDEISSIYASALWPGYEPLEAALGVDVAEHPVLGFGLSVIDYDVHPWDCHWAFDTVMFLPDYNLDFIADELLILPEFEFMEFAPCIVDPDPWPGDEEVAIHGTWNHTIEVWATDSLGEPLPLAEILGSVLMADSIDAVCVLNRPLVDGEFILAVDLNSGQSLRLPRKVQIPAADDLTIQLRPDGMLHLRWSEIEGYTNYVVKGSSDGIVFNPAAYVFGNTETVLNMPPHERYFYRVEARR